MSEALFGLLGVLVGGVITAWADVWIKSKDRKHDTKLLKVSLCSEIKALLLVVDQQKFTEDLENLKTKSAAEPNWWYMNVQAQEDYFAVYSNNLGKLGLLSSQQAESVVTFYTLAKVWLENMREGKKETDRIQAIKRLEENLDLLIKATTFGQTAAKQLSTN